jgi:hypothetical protein
MFALFGILLLVAGAVLAFAIDRSADGIDLVAIGWIMMAGGGLSLVVALIQAAGMKSMSTSNIRSERVVSSDGQHVVEEVRAD